MRLAIPRPSEMFDSETKGSLVLREVKPEAFRGGA